jgi:hypothetical protein
VVTSLSILGAGSLTTVGGGDQTVIIDGTNSSSPLMQITTAGSSSHLRVAGFTIQLLTGASKNAGTFYVDGLSSNFRMDHMHILTSINTNVAQFGGCLYGVIDHSIFDNGAGSTSNSLRIYNQGSCYSDSLQIGDQAWAHSTGLGGPNFIFVENNVFNNGIGDDCTDGGSFVWRFNTMNMTYPAPALQTHPTGGAGRIRGCRAWEIYENQFDAQSGSIASPVFWLSSGTGVMWGNTIPSSTGTGYAAMLQFQEMRTTGPPGGTYTQSATPNGWGYCGTTFNGTGSAWDQNLSTLTGRHCMDQPGMGVGDLLTGGFTADGSGSNNVCDITQNPSGCSSYTGQWVNEAVEPIYEWSDNYSPVPSQTPYFLWINTAFTNTFVANSDYYLWCDPTSQSGCTSFTGATGTGSGARSARPSTCTTGVAYWSTDQGSWNTSGSGGQGVLDKCTATNTWTNAAYTPYTYPHPLDTSGTPTASAPTFSPAAGTYSSTQTVTISEVTGGASIYYTVDGSTPTTSSTLYTAPLTVATTTTVKAIAAAAGYTNSAVGSATYTITPVLTCSAFIIGAGGSVTVGNGATIQIGGCH